MWAQREKIKLMQRRGGAAEKVILKTPFAIAEGEWIKDDQQGELFEAPKLQRRR
jgi:hypothetical protein